MKRILLVTDIFPPDIGGPATFIPALATELTALGHAVTVFCRTNQPSPVDDGRWPFRVRRLPRQIGGKAQMRLVAALTGEVLGHDLIFSNGLESQTEWACRMARRSYLLKVVGDLAWERARLYGLTRMSVDEFQTLPIAAVPGRRWVKRRLSFTQRARLIITPSDYLRRMIIGWGVDARRVFTVRNGVKLEEFAGFTPRRRGRGMFEIVFLGRLVNWKGVEYLLRAVVLLADAHLSIVGDGPEEPALRSLVAGLGLERVADFCGALPRSEVLRRLARAHVLALPSEYEGHSHTLLEACAAAVPCIASDRGGNPEVIQPEHNGLLVPYGDVAKLHTALARLQADEDLRFALAAGAKAHSRAFDFRKTMAETVKLLVA